jgi:hypothetical protein
MHRLISTYIMRHVFGRAFICFLDLGGRNQSSRSETTCTTLSLIVFSVIGKSSPGVLQLLPSSRPYVKRRLSRYRAMCIPVMACCHIISRISAGRLSSLLLDWSLNLVWRCSPSAHGLCVRLPLVGRGIRAGRTYVTYARFLATAGSFRTFCQLWIHERIALMPTYRKSLSLVYSGWCRYLTFRGLIAAAADCRFKMPTSRWVKRGVE